MLNPVSQRVVKRTGVARTMPRSEERCAELFRAGPVAMAFGTSEGRLIEVNDRFADLVGYRRGELTGERIGALLGNVDDGERLVRGLRESGSICELRTRLRRKSGEYRDVLVSADAAETDGRLGFVMTVRELADRKGTEAALRQQERLASMGQLLAAVAHELNNPLAVVIGQASLLCRTERSRRVADRAFQIVQSAERCARIVKDLLAFARNRPPERSEVRIDDVIREAVTFLAYGLRTDSVEVTCDLASALLPVWGDRHQLYQLVINLVANAQQAMRESGSRRLLTLTSSIDSARMWVALEVSDTGRGMSPDVQARIFEPFFTTKPAGQGTGLGLALCQSIVKAHGGTIGAASLPGLGTRVRVELPVERRRASRPEALAPPLASPIRSRRILIVDDEPGILSVLAAMLEVEGHHVETAASGTIALQKLGQHPYDAVLSDLRMPDLDGPGLYREIRRCWPHLSDRFAIFTGDTVRPETRTLLDKTGLPSLGKPFRLEEIRSLLERIGGPASQP